MDPVTTVRFRIGEADYVSLALLALPRPAAVGWFAITGLVVCVILLGGGVSAWCAGHVLWLFPAIGGVAVFRARREPRRRYRRSPPLQHELTLHFNASGFRLCTSPPSDLEDPGYYHGTAVVGAWLLLHVPLLPERFVPIPLPALAEPARQQLLHLLTRESLPPALEFPAGQELCWCCRGLVAVTDSLLLGGKRLCRGCKGFAVQACYEGVALEPHRSDHGTRAVALVGSAVTLALAGAAVYLRVEGPAPEQPLGSQPAPPMVLAYAGFLLLTLLCLLGNVVLRRQERRRQRAAASAWALLGMLVSGLAALVIVAAALWPC